MTSENVYNMKFGKIYLLLVNKAVKKGRTQGEVDQIITWLTGYTRTELEAALDSELSYGDFFRNAPSPNPARNEIKGVVCGVRVEEIEEPLMREIRYLDKLVDELARGNPCPLLEIAKLTGISRQTIHSAIKKLEAQGILTLESPGGRRKLVRLTEEGMELAEKTAGRLIKIENEIFDSWTGEELEQYIRLTGRYPEQFREKTGRLGV